MLLKFNLISRFSYLCVFFILFFLCVCIRERWEKETGGGEGGGGSEGANERVRRREIRCKLKKNSKSHWSSRLLNRV